MKALIQIISCKKDRQKQDAARETWIREWGHLIDYRFILGEGNDDDLQPDEWIFYKEPDTWNGLPYKVHAARHAALALGYDYVFTSTVDIWICVPRWLKAFSELDGKQYVGKIVPGQDHIGGAGYWMGRQALEAYCRVPPQLAAYEDQWTGEILAYAGIQPVNDDRYHVGDQWGAVFPYIVPNIWETNKNIAVHLGRGSGNFDPQWMRDCHQSYMNWVEARQSLEVE